MKRKGLLTLMFGALAISALASCGQTEPTSIPSTTTGTVTTTPSTSAPTSTPSTTTGTVTTTPSTSAPTSTPSTTTGTATTPEVKVLSYTEYMAAEMNTEVTIEAYVQAKQSWWSNKATLYLADEDGAYFVYELPISEEDYNKLTEGTKIRVTGVKGEWSGEIEIMGSQAGSEGTFTILDVNPYVSTAKELSLSADLTSYQNQRVTFKNLTVVAQDDGVSAFYYKWNNSGAAGQNHDLYFNVTDGKTTYSFTVESYLTAEGTDVYTAVTNLKVGDVINLEGFLYWYNAPQLHTTKLEVVSTALSYAEYMAAEMNTEVTIDGYVQAKQSWWSNKATLYLADEDGAYFVYELPISEEDYNKLTEGTKIRVTGVKGEWSGEIEIMGSQAGSEGTFTILDVNPYVSTAKELSLSADLTSYQNQRVTFKNLTVVAQDDGVSAFYYKWNNSGAAGQNHDLYFNVTDGKTTYSFTVESYLTAEGTDVYTAVTNLKVGDVINLEGFLYWYNAPQLHTTKLEVVTPASTN